MELKNNVRDQERLFFNLAFSFRSIALFEKFPFTFKFSTNKRREKQTAHKNIAKIGSFPLSSKIIISKTRELLAFKKRSLARAETPRKIKSILTIRKITRAKNLDRKSVV